MQTLRLIHNAPRPLVVDVDGGLLAHDPVRSGLRQIARRRPALALRRLVAESDRPEYALKAMLAEPGAFLPRIPVRPVAMDAIGLWRRFGAPVVLISQLPEAMVAHLRDTLCPGARLFGARRSRPLDARGKSELLEAVFGHGGFDLLAQAQEIVPGALMARRAMLFGLTEAGKRKFLAAGVRATGIPAERRAIGSVCLRAGAGWSVDWAVDGGEVSPQELPLKPETRLPSLDACDVAHLRRGKAVQS